MCVIFEHVVTFKNLVKYETENQIFILKLNKKNQITENLFFTECINSINSNDCCFSSISSFRPGPGQNDFLYNCLF